MNYRKMADVYEKLEGTTKKLEKRDILSSFYRTSDELNKVVLLSMGIVSTSLELGIAREMMKRVVMRSTGCSEIELTKKFRETGDLSSAAEFFVKNKRQQTLTKKKLTVNKVYENLMVDVDTTRNRKLVDRGTRMIQTVTGLERPAAAELLERSGGHVKTALVMHTRGVERKEAERLLAQHHGHVARILEAESR